MENGFTTVVLFMLQPLRFGVAELSLCYSSSFRQALSAGFQQWRPLAQSLSTP